MIVSVSSNIATVEFDSGHQHNPFSRKNIKLITQNIKSLTTDPEVKIIILYGGKDKSFSVGADVKEMKDFSDPAEIESWIDDVNDSYVSVLSCPKPIISVIDNYGIGYGLQLALCSDYRIGSNRCELRMPEFALGISCNFGGYLLEQVVGRSFMQEMLFNCRIVDASTAYQKGLLHQIVEHDILLEQAIKFAEKLSSYPSTAMNETKITINEQFIKQINIVAENAKNAHKKSFNTGAARHNILKLLNKNE